MSPLFIGLKYVSLKDVGLKDVSLKDVVVPNILLYHGLRKLQQKLFKSGHGLISCCPYPLI